MGVIADIEHEIGIIKAAMNVWPEKKGEYSQHIRSLKLKKLRYERAKRVAIAKSYVKRKRNGK